MEYNDHCHSRGFCYISKTLTLRSLERQKAIFILIQTNRHYFINEINAFLTDRWNWRKTDSTVKHRTEIYAKLTPQTDGCAENSCTDRNKYSHLVTNSDCPLSWTLIIKLFDTAPTYKTARWNQISSTANSDRPTDSLDENISFMFHVRVWFYLTDRKTFLFQHRIWINYSELVSEKAEQTDRQTRKLKSCMRLMEIAADVTSVLKFKLNDLTSFSSHIMTLKHTEVAGEP